MLNELKETMSKEIKQSIKIIYPSQEYCYYYLIMEIMKRNKIEILDIKIKITKKKTLLEGINNIFGQSKERIIKIDPLVLI